jgi:hypothetical protein
MPEPKRYQIIFTRQPERLVRRLPRDLLQRIDRKIMGLKTDPWPVMKAFTAWALAIGALLTRSKWSN